MIGSLRIFCRPGSALGFALAGAPAFELDDAAELEHRVDRVVDDPSVAVVLVDAALLDGASPTLARRLRELERPLILSIPAPSWRETSLADAEEAILRILRQAVGYRIRLP